MIINNIADRLTINAKNCYHKDFAHLDESEIKLYGNTDESWSHSSGAETPEVNFEVVDDFDPAGQEKHYADECIPRQSLTTRKQAFLFGLIPCFLFFLISFLMASFVREPLLALQISTGYVLGFFGALAIFSNNFPK